MKLLQKRMYERKKIDIPIRLLDFQNGSYFPAQMQNFSYGGVYFESPHLIQPGQCIHVELMDCDPNSIMPEAEKMYHAEVRWNTDASDSQNSRYGIGARFFSMSCDRCGTRIIYPSSRRMGSLLCLCESCYQTYRHMPGDVRETVENYLCGNVL